MAIINVHHIFKFIWIDKHYIYIEYDTYNISLLEQC